MGGDSLEVLDQVKDLSFLNHEDLIFLNITLAVIMFGVALDIKLDDFKKVIQNPKGTLVGLLVQFFLVPALTLLLIILIQPTQSVAFGMLLVAVCPGGNVSNFLSSYSKANIAISVSLTAIGTVLSVFLTPLNFAFWGKLYSVTSPFVRPLEIDALQMFQTVSIILGIPLVVGMYVANKYPNFAAKIRKPLNNLSLGVFVIFVIVALWSNFSYFLRYIHLIALIVFAHNTVALATGYLTGKLFKLSERDTRAVTIEGGIQNSGLALGLIFNPKIFPPHLQLGGMAFIAAWWGVWHLISGLAIAFYWSKHPPKEKTL